MAVPAILGMGVLITFLGKIFDALLEFFTKRLTKKLAVRAVFATLVVGLMASFIALLQGLLAALVFALPEEYGGILRNVVPANTALCLSAVVTANIARRIYDLKVKSGVQLWLGF